MVAFTLNDPIEQLVQAFQSYNDANPIEKIYLHTDKPYYTAGESIWLKGYAVMGPAQTLDTLSVPLYVELIDRRAERVVDKRILPMNYGFCFGDFKLADTLRSGVYQLRAYTNWMKNFGSESFFTKDFQVFEPGKASVPLVINNTAIDFQFFPEGGDLINGVENRMAFKATDASGKGVNLKGYILNAAKDTISRFEALHMGMGYINFKPTVDEKYEAKLIINNIIEQSVSLPDVKPSGYALTVDNLSNTKKLRIFIHKSADLPAAPIGVIAQARGLICFSGKVTAQKTTNYIEIPKASLPNGVIQLTIIDQTGVPHCERLIYNQSETPLNVKFTTNKPAFFSRDEVKLDLEVTNDAGEPVRGNFSVVVSDTNLVKFNKYAENVRSYFLLGSDLRGNIENPGQYFVSDGNFKSVNLDLLLMTNGWRRFTWRTLAANTLPKITHFAERGLQIKGQITQTNGKIIDKEIAISMMVKDKENKASFLTTTAEANGNFLFDNLPIVDSVRVLIQAIAGKNRRNTSIYVDSLDSPKIKMVSPPFLAVEFEDQNLAEYLKKTKEALAIEQKIRLDKAIMLEEVVVKAKKEIDNNNGRTLYSNADATIQVGGNNAYNSYQNVLDLIRGRVAGVQVTGDISNPTVVIRGAANFSGAVEPLFLLDGMPVDKSQILSIPVADVDKVDVLKGASAAIYGSRAGGGVISILTKRGDENYDWGSDAAPGIVIFTKQGYYTAREFYAPKYSENLPEHVRPDYRSTVYWNPNITTDENGKASLSFFTSDATDTQLTVQLEGLAFSGSPVVGKWAFDVR